MPMNKARYPADWSAQAQVVKDEAQWCCESCGRPCRRPGEARADFEARILETHWGPELYEEVHDDEMGVVYVPRFQRFCLTVAHLDQRPENCDRTNLRALCAPCHLRHDRPFRPKQRRLKREWDGQLSILEVES